MVKYEPSSRVKVNTPVLALSDTLLMCRFVTDLSDLSESAEVMVELAAFVSRMVLRLPSAVCTSPPVTPLMALVPISPAPPVPESASIRLLNSSLTLSRIRRSNTALFCAAVPVSLSGAAITPFCAMAVSVIL